MKHNNQFAYLLSTDELVRSLDSDIDGGLSNQLAAQRLAQNGANVIPEAPTDSLFVVFFRQFKSPLIYILLIAAAIIFFVDYPLDAFIISGILFFNAIIGTIQEGRTQNILASLQKFIMADSVVLREGEHIVLPDKDLVVGDIIILQEGSKVPADARIFFANDLRVNESTLTGESTAVTKTMDVLSDKVPIAEQHNMVFRGTFVISGFGKAIVTATGLDTEIGRIQKTIKTIQPDMPIKKDLEKLSRWILIFVFIFCIVLFGIGLITGKPYKELLVMLTALFICVVPEGLPVVLTLVLVSGAYRMAKQKVLVKRLQAVEALGRIQTILIDKTGTLTRNEMMVCQVAVGREICSVTGEGYFAQGAVQCGSGITPENKEQLQQIANASILSHAEISYMPNEGLFRIKGDPTEAALIIFAEKLGVTDDSLKKEFKLIKEFPFSSEKRFQAGFYEHKSDVVAFLVGSPEAVIQRCVAVTENIEITLNNFLKEGLRVIAIATKICPKQAEYTEDNLKDMKFLGLLGIQDAIRVGVDKSIKQAHDKELHVAMVTGDHKDTALYVARQTGIYRDGDIVIMGTEFENANEAQRIEIAKKATVYARVAPHTKFEIVKTYHKMNEIVAMTGDGVNDAPSLAAADIGIAMGSIGTAVAKEAADVILLDDSFSSIMAGIEEGHHIFYALRRVILYFFATNLGEVLVVLFALAANLPLPILAAQILWLNLITDGFLDIALSMEPHEQGIRKYFNVNNLKLIDTRMLTTVFYMALPMGIGSLAVFLWYYQTDLSKARTMTLLTMAMFQWCNAWNCRSEYKSIFSLNPFSNKWLILATVWVVFLQWVVIYNPYLQFIFRTVPIAGYEWLIVMCISSTVIFMEEIRKLVVRLT
ncbi:hypothetical protein A3F06_01110 [candidate division TM6 bacterium RIFCSPHIGHO2_12_FULL_36_22]|nr:MAG: hypothetical protein A3F06_01110 [candidate division TM6 bacterium RIFCSPHIGHO2_12_FULL_36_22]